MSEFPGLEIGQRIDGGRYGEVFQLLRYSQPAVIKIIKCSNENRRQMFQKECEIMMKLQSSSPHPNIVNLLEIKGSNQSLKVGIILEYCAGGNLKTLIKESKIIYSMRTVVEWGIQLFGALSHLFQVHQIVHRDIKPENILIKDTIDYTLKIGDFGTGKVIDQTCEPTQLAGTDRYRSPPQFYGNLDPKEIKKDVMDSHKNDVYSLGLVLWEIIERKESFTQYESEFGFDREALLCDILLKRVSSLNSPKCQEEIQRIVDRCVLFDRHSRSLATDVLNLLKEIIKTNNFMSSLELSPRHDENQTDLIRPIGFDGTLRRVNRSEIDQFTERLSHDDPHRLYFDKTREAMQEKFSALSPEEQQAFVKDAERIVSELQQESRYIDDIDSLVEEAVVAWEDQDIYPLRRNKTMEETFKFRVLLDFDNQVDYWTTRLFSDEFSVAKPGHSFLHFGFWYPIKHSSLVDWISSLEEMKSTQYTINPRVRCYFSQASGEEWLYLGSPLYGEGLFVRKDFKLCKAIDGAFLTGKEKKVWQCESGGSSSLDNDPLYYSHDETFDIDRQVEVFKERLELGKKRARVYIESLVPVEQLKDRSQCVDFFTNLIESPYPGYIFQLRNPPRPICKHQGKCSMDGFQKITEVFDLAKELHIPICSEISRNEVAFWKEFVLLTESLDLDNFDHSVRPFLFLAFQNFLDFDFFVLLDHPNNYSAGEKIPGFTLERKFHYVDAKLVEKHLNEIDPTKRIYAYVLIDECRNMDGWRWAVKKIQDEYHREYRNRMYSRHGCGRRNVVKDFDRRIASIEERWSRCKDMGEWMNEMHEVMNMDGNGMHSDLTIFDDMMPEEIIEHEWMEGGLFKKAMDEWYQAGSMKMQILDYQGNPKTEWFKISDKSTWPEGF